MKVLGDDCLVAVKTNVNLAEVLRVSTGVFRLCLNINNSEDGRLVSFLGYRMLLQGTTMGSYDKFVAQLLLPASADRFLAEFGARLCALQLCLARAVCALSGAHGAWGLQ